MAGVESEFFADNGPAHHVAASLALDIPTLLGAVLGPADGGVRVTDRPFEDLAVRFMRKNLLGASTGLAGHGHYHLATADAGCVTVDAVAATTPVELGTLATPTAAGAPLSVEVADGGTLVAGTPTVDALVTAAGVDTRAFFALSVGTSPVDARVVQNNVLPLRQLLPVAGEQRSIELPSIAVEVPAGQKLFLTISPVSDMFGGHGSRTPGAFLLQDVVVNLPVQRTG